MADGALGMACLSGFPFYGRLPKHPGQHPLMRYQPASSDLVPGGFGVFGIKVNGL